MESLAAKARASLGLAFDVACVGIFLPTVQTVSALEKEPEKVRSRESQKEKAKVNPSSKGRIFMQMFVL